MSEIVAEFVLVPHTGKDDIAFLIAFIYMKTKSSPLIQSIVNWSI